MTRNVLVFCGASDAVDVVFKDAAFAIGRAIGERGGGVVYGGHHAGLMGAVADGCRGAGGPVLGILPDVLRGKEHPPEGIELVRVADMHARKALMVEKSDVIIALPGGYGTLDELFEQLTWRVIGVHQKPVGMLDVLHNGKSYWQPLLFFLDHAVDEGFIRRAARDVLFVDADVGGLLDRLGIEATAASSAPP